MAKSHSTLAVHERDSGIVRVEEKETLTQGGVSPGTTKFAVAYRRGEVDDLADGGTTEALVESGEGLLRGREE